MDRAMGLAAADALSVPSTRFNVILAVCAGSTLLVAVTVMVPACGVVGAV